MLPLTFWWVIPMVLWAYARDPAPVDSSEDSLPEVISPSQDSLQDITKNLARLMEDDALFKEYYRCLVDQGPCTSNTSKFKEFVSEALERGCARCSANQRAEAIKLLRVVMECRPREYEQIERQYDPSGAFKTKYSYKASLAARKRNIPLPLPPPPPTPPAAYRPRAQ